MRFLGNSLRAARALSAKLNLHTLAPRLRNSRFRPLVEAMEDRCVFDNTPLLLVPDIAGSIVARDGNMLNTLRNQDFLYKRGYAPQKLAADPAYNTIITQRLSGKLILSEARLISHDMHFLVQRSVQSCSRKHGRRMRRI